MARVFISYRRADGQYAVGWIEERLRKLDGVSDISTAFRDSDLRYGDNFRNRLQREVRECDVLLAVIGKEWRGLRADGTARIFDPEDWVGSEITTALDKGKVVIPVLLEGTEQPDGDDLASVHRKFADLNSMRFDDRTDLDELEQHVREHLDRIDQTRAQTAGLDRPINPRFERTPWWHWLAVVPAGLFGALLGWLIVTIDAEADDPSVDLALWQNLSIAQVAVWGILGTLGLVYYRATLWRTIDVRWWNVATVAAFALVVVAWAIVALGVASPVRGGAVRQWLQILAAFIMLGPWLLILLSAGWSADSSGPFRVRIQAIATQRRGLSYAAPALVSALVLPILTTAELTKDGNNDPGLVAYGVFLSLLVGVALELGHRNLRRDSTDVRDDIKADLHLANVRHGYAEQALVDGPRDLWATLMWWTLVPTFVTFVAAVYWE